jgi:hypothetical protein
MWKILAPLATGISLLLTAPFPAAGPTGQAILPGGRVVRTVEIKGKLQWDPTEIARPYDVYWYVPVGGQRYYLHFGNAKAAQKQAWTLKGAVVVTGRLEAAGRWLVVHVDTLKEAGEETLEQRTYRGPSADYWRTADTIFALKIGDRRPLAEHIRDLLRKDVAGGSYAVWLEDDKLVVTTTADNHAKIKEFLRLLATIPGPAR